MPTYTQEFFYHLVARRDLQFYFRCILVKRSMTCHNIFLVRSQCSIHGLRWYGVTGFTDDAMIALQMNANVTVVDGLDIDVSHLVATTLKHHELARSKVHTASGCSKCMTGHVSRSFRKIWKSLLETREDSFFLTASCRTMPSKFSVTLFLMLCALSSCYGDDSYDWDCSAEEKQEVVSTWNAVYGVGHGRRSALAEGVFLRYVLGPLRARH